MHPEDHMKTIGIDQSLSNRPSVEHTLFIIIKNIYQNSGKCDDQQNLKYILDGHMVSTPEDVTDVSTSLRITQKSKKSKCSEINVVIQQHILC